MDLIIEELQYKKKIFLFNKFFYKIIDNVQIFKIIYYLIVLLFISIIFYVN